VFEKSLLPAKDGHDENQRLEAIRTLFVARCDSPVFLDSLEEILHSMAFLVVPSVKWLRVLAVILGRDARLKTQAREEIAKGIAIIGFVRQDGAGRLARDQIPGKQDVVPIACRKDNGNGTPFGIDESVNLGVLPSASSSNLLISRGFCGAKPVLVDLDAGRIDGPEHAVSALANMLEDALPKSGIAPTPPTGVNRGVGSKDRQGSPGAALPNPIEDGLQNHVGVQRRSPKFPPIRVNRLQVIGSIFLAASSGQRPSERSVTFA
jgi:hypothetical protein